jgi:hypothetical protein
MTTSPTATPTILTPEAAAQARRERRERRLEEERLLVAALRLRSPEHRARLIELALA